MAQVQQAPARTRQQRKVDTLELLTTDRYLWLATSTGEHSAHAIPMTYYWDGERLITATMRHEKTGRNLQRTGRARALLGTPAEAVVVEGAASLVEVDDADPATLEALAARWTSPINFRAIPGFVVIQLQPKRIQAYRVGRVEFDDRDLMKDGKWLV
jgi:general stress protein 26